MSQILVVDDNERYVDAIERALHKHKIIRAASLVEAQKICTEDFDLALVDVRLCETDIANRDGIILLEWMRREFPMIPVAIMSGYADHDAAVNALNLGAIRYLKKPIGLDDLENIVEEFAHKKTE
jgi:DNA-binding NtrC family response regulator